LRRWEELRSELDQASIAIVTVSSDTPDEIKQGRRKHGLGATMLADPELSVADEFNLINPENMTPRGLRKPMPIPTTFLVDAKGMVRWIDQSDDYMLRSAPERVLAAIRENLA
jgi:peroxiredoxin